MDQADQLCGDLRKLSPSDLQAVRDELKRVLESDQFRTSRRSRKFLQHVVEKALSGDFGDLKERILGVQLFQRDWMFDTDHDAVVRVAANDTRARLREYYREHPAAAVQLSLPSGTYIPKIESEPENPAGVPALEAPPAQDAASPSPARKPRRKWLLPLAACLAVASALGVFVFFRHPVSAAALPPWSAILKSRQRIQIVVADANLVINKVRSAHDLPMETYASHNFAYARDIPGPFGEYLNTIPLTTVADAILATRIQDLASKAGVGTQVRYANRLEFADLKGEEPIILFGSPMSNPWVQLLSDQLNFQVVHQFDTGMDVCINRRPRSGEPATFTPSRNLAGFSRGYALVALVQNLSGRAPVLIIAGTSTEGTEAAGELLTNPGRLSEALKKIGIEQRSNLQRMELVIETAFVSAASATSTVVAYRVP